MKIQKLEKELKVVSRSFTFGSEYGNYYLVDNDGKNYFWYTASETAYEEMKEETRVLCKFTETSYYYIDNSVVYYEVKNVRFKVI